MTPTFIAVFPTLSEWAEALVGPVLDDGTLGSFGTRVTSGCTSRRLFTARHAESTVRTFTSGTRFGKFKRYRFLKKWANPGLF